VPSVGDRPPRDLSRQSLAEVVEPRYDELFTLIQAELRRSGFEDLIPSGVVLTGGTAKMEGAVELAEEIFHMPVRIGYPQGVEGLADIVRNPSMRRPSACCSTAPAITAASVAGGRGAAAPGIWLRLVHWLRERF
jgi:cell division protein FtsA